MTSALAWLAGFTFWSSAAIVFVLLLRVPVRRHFGAGRAAVLWLAIPLALTVSLVPGPQWGSGVSEAAVVQAIAAPAGSSPAASTPGRSGGWLEAVWITGGLAMLGLLWARQRRLGRELGRIEPRGDGTWRSQTNRYGPLIRGWVRPRILLPADFETRYTPRQQRLILCHERIHCARLDGLWNLLAAGLRCIFWFNPLVHFAASRFHLDQELACDEAVMRAMPGTRHAYAEALLATHINPAPVPSSVRAFGQHPLKERIMMLKCPPSNRRRLIGACMTAIAVAALTFTVWAASPAPPGHFTGPDFSLDMKVVAGGIELDRSRWIVEEAEIEFRNLPIAEHMPEGAGGDRFSGLQLDYPEAADGWSGNLGIARIHEDFFAVRATIIHAGEVIATPQMIVTAGNKGVMKTGQENHEEPALHLEVVPYLAGHKAAAGDRGKRELEVEQRKGQ